MCDGLPSTDGSLVADEAPSRAPSPILLRPKARSYYALAEDTHPATRIATASKLLKEERLAPRLEPHATRDPRTEDEVVDRYLKSDPASFAVFGKPGSDGADVASAIASARNCVLISPVSLIRREIDAETEKGRYMERELRHGECVGPEIVMSLMRCRVRRRDVRHRGYVVAGLPLVPNSAKLDHSSYPTSVSDKDGTEFCESAAPEGNGTRDQGRLASRGCPYSPDSANCGARIDHEREIPRQIDEIFAVWPVKPRIIIYIVCPRRDVASRCARGRAENSPVDESEYTVRPLGDERGRNKSDGSFDFHLATDEWPIVPDDRRVYAARRISERADNIEAQCDLYERLALPAIDEWILAYNPEHVIRVDGRSSARRTLEIIDARLCVLPLQPSILPERVAKWCDEDRSETSSEMAASGEEFAERSAEEVFQALRRREVVSARFPWRLSAWRFHCPVELAQGRAVKGLPSHPVRFLSKIFFLSSQRAESLFVENPRTFLSSPNPRPTCKIAVFGPRYAGKSELSARLAKVFGGTVINVDRILREAIEERVDRKALDVEDETRRDADLSCDYAPEELSARGYPRGSDSDARVTSGRAECTRDEFVGMSADEIADVIVENVRRVPVEKLEDELHRDGGYVVDGMRADVEVWRRVVDGGGVAFEDVVVLHEDRPYVYMLERFHGYARVDVDSSCEGEHGAEAGEYEIPREEWEYFEHLKQFDSEWARFERCLAEFRGGVVRCNLAGVKDAAAEYVVSHIKGRSDVTGAASVQERDEETGISEGSTITDDKARLTDDEEGGEEGEEGCPIDLETAERLLELGYYFFSPLGRWCPVQVYNGETLVQMFLPMRARGQIFPVIRRYYVYFLAGEEAFTAFLKNPSKYLARDSPLPPPPPPRIAVVGPPKCGKTTLASRFARTYGMERITRGGALRHMLKHYGWIESARLTEDQLRAGEAASTELVARAVEMLSIGPRASTQGYVLDGCPSGRDEAERLALLGIEPMIVLDLRADLPFCLECLSRGNDDARRPPNFPASFLSLRYANWQKHQADLREWLRRFSRNVIELNATKSKWHVWTRADGAARSRFADVALYHCYANHDRVLSLRYMCVSPYEFRSRQNRYESYCPVCLFHEDTLRVSDRPTDGRGMVQFREHFYWICPRHVDAFTKDPLRHLPPVNTASLPDERPRALEQTVDAKHACWARRLRVDGLCLVTYIDGLPGRELARGRTDLAVLLEDRVYLFCSETCRDKFLSQPGKYAEADVPSPRAISPADARCLPDLGFLERTVSRAVIEAVTRVAARRPKVFGLSAAVSAAIHIGVRLKTRATSREADVYVAASERMAGWDKIIRTATDTMKRKLNPYVYLPRGAAPLERPRDRV